jgi:hypothetical protein
MVAFRWISFFFDENPKLSVRQGMRRLYLLTKSHFLLRR